MNGMKAKVLPVHFPVGLVLNACFILYCFNCYWGIKNKSALSDIHTHIPPQKYIIHSTLTTTLITLLIESLWHQHPFLTLKFIWLYGWLFLFIYCDIHHGVILFGSLGYREAFLIFFNAQYNITTLSSPIPPPPWGKAPYLKQSM